jgi:hypothetical protein
MHLIYILQQYRILLLLFQIFTALPLGIKELQPSVPTVYYESARRTRRAAAAHNE